MCAAKRPWQIIREWFHSRSPGPQPNTCTVMGRQGSHKFPRILITLQVTIKAVSLYSSWCPFSYWNSIHQSVHDKMVSSPSLFIRFYISVLLLYDMLHNILVNTDHPMQKASSYNSDCEMWDDLCYEGLTETLRGRSLLIVSFCALLHQGLNWEWRKRWSA